jgi:hypothetical protein
MRATTLGIVLLVAIVIGMACGAQQRPQTEKSQEILELWGQIRTWRVEKGWGAEPHPSTLLQVTKQTVKQAESVCPEGHTVPKTCDDVCNLADAICDNAERICQLADELASDWARDKCTSAKGSCRDAKQRCCQCSETDSKAASKASTAW